MIKIKQNFNEQYTLHIDTDMQGVNVQMKTKMKLRWDFNVLKVQNDEIEIKLILLDHILLETNNPMVKEAAALTKVFSRLYNELHLIIDTKGIVKKILNLHVILDKWKDVKTEMLAVAEKTPDINNAIQLHDSIFNDEKKLIQGIQYGEFFTVYFNKIFGTELPHVDNLVTEPNFFKTANVQWKYSILKANEDIGFPITNVILRGVPFLPLEPGFYTRAYSQFSNIKDIGNLTTKLEENGKYEIDSQTGRVIEVHLFRNEVADDDLYMKLSYKMYSEGRTKENLEKNKEGTTVNHKKFDDHKEDVSRVYKIVDGKKYTYEEWKKYEQEQWEIYQERKKKKGFSGF